VEEVKHLVELYKGEELIITIVCHSLGTSLALLAAEKLTLVESEALIQASKGISSTWLEIFAGGTPRLSRMI
jgi:hypothetical protein